MRFPKFLFKYPVYRNLNFSIATRSCSKQPLGQSSKEPPVKSSSVQACSKHTLGQCDREPPPLKGSGKTSSGQWDKESPPPKGSSNTLGQSDREPPPLKSSGDGSGLKGLVLCVYEDGDKFELTVTTKEIDQKSGGKICAKLSEHSCQLKLGNAVTFTDIVPEYDAIAIASLGPKDAGYNVLEHLDENRENVRWAVGAGVAALKARGAALVSVDTAAHPDAAAEAAELAAWDFQEFNAVKKPGCSVVPYITGAAGLWGAGVIHGRGQNWARLLSDMPANKMTPVDLAQAALDVLCPLGIQVLVHETSWQVNHNMQAFRAVARGSCEPPLFLECIYRGGGSSQPVLLAAKGVTFDCGGMCLKSPDEMRDNRGSMAGAAVTLAALKIIAELKTKLNVTAVIPVCENMISGQCMKVGDVVPALNGKFIQIEDTDMEGRLMLADALVYGQSAHKPACVVDVGTLTKGILLATGGGAYGCFSNSDCLYKRMQHAGAATGDRPWRFPLWEYYNKQITNCGMVDLRNKGSGRATPCIGAAFLKNFICGDWLHLDITGVGKLSHTGAPPYLRPARMSGRPARALAQLLDDFGKHDDEEAKK